MTCIISDRYVVRIFTHSTCYVCTPARTSHVEFFVSLPLLLFIKCYSMRFIHPDVTRMRCVYVHHRGSNYVQAKLKMASEYYIKWQKQSIILYVSYIKNIAYLFTNFIYFYRNRKYNTKFRYTIQYQILLQDCNCASSLTLRTKLLRYITHVCQALMIL